MKKDDGRNGQKIRRNERKQNLDSENKLKIVFGF